MTDECQRALQPQDVSLETSQTIQVQIVGRLVQQQYVEARQHQRSQTNSCCLAAGQRVHVLGQQSLGQTKFAPHLPSSNVKVGGTQRKPGIEGIAVPIIGANHRATKVCGGGIKLDICCSNARAPPDIVGNGLVKPLRLLVEVANGGRWRRGCHRAIISVHEPSQNPKQRRFANTVGADEAHPMSRIK